LVAKMADYAFGSNPPYALLAAQTASAQSSYPNQPVKILVGFTPGTAPDLAARILADRFSEIWGTPFVVENLPGAGSNIATDRVAVAASRRASYRPLR
jgi:tripartite-type tricarboxylate transporter receptor subunit TctC